MKEKDLFKLIYEKQKKNFKNINIKNEEKIIISFSGVPGSGKTYIAKILEKTKWISLQRKCDRLLSWTLHCRIKGVYLQNPSQRSWFLSINGNQCKNLRYPIPGRLCNDHGGRPGSAAPPSVCP